MTIDLKGPYDMVEAARVAYEIKAAEIAELLKDGTNEENVNQALALQESLDQLQANYESKKALYAKLVQANTPSDVASLFVPVSETAPEADAKDQRKSVMSIAEFRALSPKERLAFAKAGGKIEEGE